MKVTVRVTRKGQELVSIVQPIESDGTPATTDIWVEAICMAAQACKTNAFINETLLDDDTVVEFSIQRQERY
ncbi:hypothetical protein GCM10011371_13050 [Novosphingobium marinum]|uniref:Uncharacterized protein n=1 Tax=Novosphingobium marinum TaxID=1514948 RepID=A0A7Y9XYG1_9SPHN|nr:hypothetical protein [Novosphingobium marinum]NYH95413.1 hypothetical protein [Novosphingobium marinum]GGC26861.1 hypothetical protein GCM10011371_13050 [Novosphingobium marinum]